MKKTGIAVLFAAVLLLPAVSQAQAVVDCWDCTLGIYDEQTMLNTTGTMVQNVPKNLYLGIKLGTGQTGLTGIEFSVTGLDGFTILGTPAIVAEATRIGVTIMAPADTTETSEGAGGFNINWADCLVGDRALVRINIISFTAPPIDRVIEVKRKYPTNRTDVHVPLIVGCDAPVYTQVRVTAGCYVLNPSGNGPGCPTAVQDRTWSQVKELYD